MFDYQFIYNSYAIVFTVCFMQSNTFPNELTVEQVLQVTATEITKPSFNLSAVSFGFLVLNQNQIDEVHNLQMHSSEICDQNDITSLQLILKVTLNWKVDDILGKFFCIDNIWYNFIFIKSVYHYGKLNLHD